MARGRRGLATVLAATMVAYLIALRFALRWHWNEGPPHTQATAGLLLSFGLCAAIVGLSSVSIALATIHWTRRAAGLIVGVALLGLLWTPRFVWNEFLIWQLFVMLGSQTAVLVLALGTASLFGTGLGRSEVTDGPAGRAPSGKAFQLSIPDFSILIAALALLCVTIRGSRPIALGPIIYGLNVAAGSCAALVALTVFWSCLGTAPAPPRVLALLVVAPTGGALFVMTERYATLLFNAPWYSGVTSAQVLLMAIPCLVLRARGYRYTRGR